MESETRVRMGFKQTSKGGVQMDLTSEAPTVQEAGDQLELAIRKFRTLVHATDLEIVGEEKPKEAVKAEPAKAG